MNNQEIDFLLSEIQKNVSAIDEFKFPPGHVDNLAMRMYQWNAIVLLAEIAKRLPEPKKSGVRYKKPGSDEWHEAEEII